MNERTKEIMFKAGIVAMNADHVVFEKLQLEHFAELVRQDEREQAEKQEPVAWMVRDSIDGSWYPCAFENPAGAIKGESKPLYAVPQQAEKQEPIAWMVYTLDGASAFVTDNPNDFTELHSCFALYTAPPRKEWVGLTDEEIVAVNKEEGTCWEVPDSLAITVAKAIEAKLKEKNT